MKKVVLIAGTILLASSFMKSQTTWNTNGNALTVTDYIGTNAATNTNPIRFKTGTGSLSSTRMQINGGVDGFIGMNVATPLSRLHIDGSLTFGSNVNNQRWRLLSQTFTNGKLFILPDNGGNADYSSALTINPATGSFIFGNETGLGHFITGKGSGLSGNSGIGYMAFNLQRGSGSWYNNAGAGGSVVWGNKSGSLIFASLYGSSASAVGYYSDADIESKKTMELRWNNTANMGQVVIGPQTITSGAHTDFRLSVDGKVLTKEIYVTASNWADYVFDNNYKLKPLSEVEAFVKANHHLPNIPSAKEISERGNNMGDTDRLLLEKIEELTLYIIAQDKRIKELEEGSNK